MNVCGRYSITTEHGALRRHFAVTNSAADVRPRYNAAPTQALPVVRLNKDGERELAMLRWGLIPSGANDPGIGASNINAQAETVHRMPAFRTAFRRRRCLVLADGFYKWQASSRGRQAYRFTMKNGAPFAMAGLWERWDRGADAIESFAIIAGVANEYVRPIHDRMPVILEPASCGEWLDSEGATIPMALLQFRPTVEMTVHAVSQLVDDPRNDDPSVITPMGA